MNIFDFFNPDMKINKALKLAIKESFEPLGIVGYSGCCRLGCSGAYDENVEDFPYREKGLLYFKLFLSGMNYDPNPQSIAIVYTDLDYVKANWTEEKKLIEQWCRILGLAVNEYEIVMPSSDDTCILVNFVRKLELEQIEYDDLDHIEQDERDD